MRMQTEKDSKQHSEQDNAHTDNTIKQDQEGQGANLGSEMERWQGGKEDKRMTTREGAIPPFHEIIFFMIFEKTDTNTSAHRQIKTDKDLA